jgi:polysaccharide deacetylase 2 family uncharacterized protein YibQ
MSKGFIDFVLVASLSQRSKMEDINKKINKAFIKIKKFKDLLNRFGSVSVSSKT